VKDPAIIVSRDGSYFAGWYWHYVHEVWDDIASYRSPLWNKDPQKAKVYASRRYADKVLKSGYFCESEACVVAYSDMKWT